METGEPCAISSMHSDLLSTIASFCDLHTSACVLCLVCKAWRDACNSPLAFAGQHLVLTHPTAAIRWAHCFTLVKCIDVRCNKQLEFIQITDALSRHVSLVQHLRVNIFQPAFLTPFSRALARFSESVRKLTHIKLVVNMPNDKDDIDGIVSSVGWDAFDDTRFVTAFSNHFPHITSLRFVNMYGQVIQMAEEDDFGYLGRKPPKKVWAHPQALIRSLSSLHSLTSLRWASCFQLHSLDDLLNTISHACPQLQDFRMAPGVGSDFSSDGIIAFGAGCPRINSIGMRMWRHVSPQQIGTLLSTFPNLHTLDLRSTGRDAMWSYPLPRVAVSCLATVLAGHRHVTRLIIDVAELARMFWSPYTLDVTIYYPYQRSVSHVAEYLARIPQVRTVTLRVGSRVASNVAPMSVEDFLHLRSVYPTVEQLVWQRDWLTASDPFKSEEVFRAENGDPKTYRVLF